MSAGKAQAKAAPLGRGGIPEVHLSLPVALALLALFLFVGGGMTYVALAQTGRVAQPTPVPSASPTTSITPTPSPETPTITTTAQATPTNLSYTVKELDTCGGIAAVFNISIQSLLLANNLGSDCGLFIGQVLSVPQPTYTATPLASATLSEFQATIAACETVDYVVQEGETMSLIAVTFGVPLENIMEWNNLSSDIAFTGQRLIVPLCERTFVGGATVTPTIAPPYPSAELLLPADGEPFDSSADTISLQWASVGTLRGNEYYQVMIVDITGGQNRRITDEVKDTSFIVPTNFRPSDGRTHIFSWFVVPVAQIGVDAEGLPVYVAGGPNSDTRYFSWSGTSGVVATPSP